MAERPDLAREAIRFALGAGVGVVVAFWIGLVWEEAGRQYLRTTVVTAVACGLLAQLPGHRVRSTAESAAPYVLGAVGLVILLFVVSQAFRLRDERMRCLRCCQAAGYPSMIYPKQDRFGPRECRCHDRSVPGHPRTDAQVCADVGPRR